MTTKKEAYQDATLYPSETFATTETYTIWRRKTSTKRPYLVANKLVASKPKKRKVRKRDTPTWKAKLEKEITRKWSDLSILTEVEKGSNIKRTKRDQIKKRYDI